MLIELNNFFDDVKTEISKVVDNKLAELGLLKDKEKAATSQNCNELQQELIQLIIKERQRQDAKWGEQNHFPEFWTGILGEEYGKFYQAVNETVFVNGTVLGGHENMKKEAIQAAAVALCFLERLERNRQVWGLK